MEDITPLILQHLPLKDILTYSLVSKIHYKYIHLPNLWTILIKRDFDFDIVTNTYETYKYYYKLVHIKNGIFYKSNIKGYEQIGLYAIPSNIDDIHGIELMKNLKVLHIRRIIHPIIIPPEICQLKELVKLDIRFNKDGNLPTEIGQLPKLEILILERNNLSSIPTEIGQLQKLKMLDLEDNNLTHIPTEIGQLTNLHKLNLSKNNLTHIPTEIGQLTNLERLFIRNNNLLSLPKEITNLKKLHKLHVCDNYQLETPPHIYTMPNLNIIL